MATNFLKILPDLSLVVEMEPGEDAAVVNEAMSAFAEPTETTATSGATASLPLLSGRLGVKGYRWPQFWTALKPIVRHRSQPSYGLT
jgi:hypothetical protein